MAVPAAKQNLRIYSFHHHVGCSPFAGDDRVESQVPPEVVREFLRAAIQLPLPQDLETFVIHHKNSARTASIRCPQRADKDSTRTAMHRVWGCISRASGQGLWLDHFYNLRFARIRLGINDMDSRGVDARHNQVASLHMGMRSVR